MAKVLKQSPLNKLTRTSHVAEQYSRMSSPIDTITGKIVRRTLRLLLEIEGFGQQGVDPAEEREGEVWQLVEKASDCVKKLIEDPHQLGKRPTLSDLEERQWEIHAGNFHSEYMYVAGQIFSDGINWGRIVALLGFASTYSLYAMDRGIDQSAVESVCGWTIVFMERELGGWLRQNSWVSGILWCALSL